MKFRYVLILVLGLGAAILTVPFSSPTRYFVPAYHGSQVFYFVDERKEMVWDVSMTVILFAWTFIVPVAVITMDTED